MTGSHLGRLLVILLALSAATEPRAQKGEVLKKKHGKYYYPSSSGTNRQQHNIRHNKKYNGEHHSPNIYGYQKGMIEIHRKSINDSESRFRTFPVYKKAVERKKVEELMPKKRVDKKYFEEEKEEEEEEKKKSSRGKVYFRDNMESTKEKNLDSDFNIVPQTTTPASSLCPSVPCNSDLEISKQIRIMQIKTHIMKETGIQSLPNMTGFVLPKFPYLERIILDVNKQQQMAEKHIKVVDEYFLGDDPDIRSEKMFISASTCEDVIKIPEQLKNQYYYFKLGREHSTSIAKANLHFWLKPSPHSPHSEKAKISIMKVEPPKYANDFNRLRNISSSVVAYDASGKWETFDVFSLVREWLVDVENNLGIVVKVETLSGSSISIESLDDNPSHAPLLEIDVKEERNDRRKRFANKRMCSDTNIARECCKYPLIMDFTQYKFDFIVAPKKYVANYCRGECPFLYAQKMPHSTILNQMFPNASASTFGPCCGASNLSPLKLIYYDGKKIKVDVINEMVVNQCSCT